MTPVLYPNQLMAYTKSLKALEPMGMSSTTSLNKGMVAGANTMGRVTRISVLANQIIWPHTCDTVRMSP